MRVVLGVLVLGLFCFEVFGGTKEFCADRWPGDVEMQGQCRKDQAKAHAEINRLADAHGLLNAKGQIYVEPTGGDIEKTFYDCMKQCQSPEFGTFDFKFVSACLNTLIGVPDEVLKEIKMRNKDEQSVYLQIRGCRYLQDYKPSNIPENVIRAMKRDVSQRHPYNYTTQKALFKKKVMAYYSSHNLAPAEDSRAYGEWSMRREIKRTGKRKRQGKKKEVLDQLLNRTEEVMYIFSGPNDKVTEVFEVSLGWLIKWRNQSDRHFSIWVYSENGDRIALAANETEIGTGIEKYAKGGRFYLEVTSKGNWDVKIIEMELVDGKQVKMHHEYIEEGWEEKRRSLHD